MATFEDIQKEWEETDKIIERQAARIAWLETALREIMDNVAMTDKGVEICQMDDFSDARKALEKGE